MKTLALRETRIPVVYQVEQVAYKAEKVLNLSGGICADPEYADVLNFLAQNEWHFEQNPTGRDRSE